MAKNVEYYLACFPAKPIRLLPDRAYSIGRAPGNNIVLADSDVSRRHAIITWDGDKFVMKDLGSRNGTYVNRQHIKEAPLRDGDKIRVGNRVFTFMEEAEAAVKKLYLKKRAEAGAGITEILDVEKMMTPVSGFAGSISDFGLPELVQALDLNRKTGKLSVVSDRGRGTMLVREGQIVSAEMGAVRGEDAVYEMLVLDAGFFEFESGEIEQEQEQEIRIKTSQFLMEAFRRIDEARRDED